jgi:UDP-N-acetyl-D-galactosamine dehydrogenase
VSELKEYGAQVDIHDPWVDAAEAQHEYGIDLTDPAAGDYDAVVLAVAHREFAEGGSAALRVFGKADAILVDVKGILPLAESDLRL